jgi:hypothetical protein
MPLVIVEGPEAAGKTTIIEALMEEWGPNSRQRSWGPRDSWMEYCQPLFDDLKACKEDPHLLIVWSRSWISRMVYNKLLSQGQSVPPQVTLELDNTVLRQRGILIFVEASVTTLLSRRLARVTEGGHKPDHPIDSSKELSEFQSVLRQRKWKNLSGNDDVDYNVGMIMKMLVQRNPECRMGTKEEVLMVSS